MKRLHSFDKAYHPKYVVESRGSNIMNGKRLRKSQSGQGLVEYALILVLVALAVIVAAFLVGQATTRIFGVVLGATGGKADTGATQIYAAECVVDTTASKTAL